MGDSSSLKALLQLAVAVAIVVSTYYAIVGIAEYKADALAGGGAFVLDGRQAAETAALDALRGSCGSGGSIELAASLARLRALGAHLGRASAHGRSQRHLRQRPRPRVEDLLATRRARGPRACRSLTSAIPEAAQRAFATIRLAGTLFHELQHYEGVQDEGAAYEREMAWYRDLGERNAERLAGEEGRWFDWAVASALDSAGRRQGKGQGHATLLTWGARGCYKCVTVVPAPIPPGRSRTSR